ncbi:Lariat debranching enzyme [Grifola frondosa]|uniref:Lariat debranching enzyme n=1 Tax=Grifola frondosa TaxID=5627 RepID=A0A1C7MGI8_GRIFR|nr:Lariat debranching enzyme [Grifola frondosa]
MKPRIIYGNYITEAGSRRTYIFSVMLAVCRHKEWRARLAAHDGPPEITEARVVVLGAFALSFEAIVQHGELTKARGKTAEKSAERTNPDEIVIADDEELGEADTGHNRSLLAPASTSAILKNEFLALDKCLPFKKFLEVIDIQSPPGFKRPESAKATDTPVLAFDPEWLAITRAFNPYMSRTIDQLPYPNETQAREAVRTELEWVKTNILQDEGVVPVDRCQTFEMTAPPPSSKVLPQEHDVSLQQS